MTADLPLPHAVPGVVATVVPAVLQQTRTPDPPSPPSPAPSRGRLEIGAQSDGGGRVTVKTDDGRTIVVGPGGVSITDAEAPGSAAGTLVAGPGIPEGVTTIAVAFFVMLVLILVGRPIAKALARRIERSPATPRLAPEFHAELQSLRSMVETLSVDVERVAEGQRWLTRNAAERATTAADAARQS